MQMKCPKKLDNLLKQKLLTLPKGLVGCEP